MCSYGDKKGTEQASDMSKGENIQRKSAGDIKDTLPDGRVVLCGANAYEQKYFFNERFAQLPESIREELRIICVLFTQEVGGIFLMVFDEDGDLTFETNAEEEDITYDEVSCGLMIGEIRRNRQELLESLNLYYRVFILKEDIAGLLDEEE